MSAQTEGPTRRSERTVPGSSRKKWALRIVFAAAILLLPVELVAQRVAGTQPYPGLYQPSFADTPLTNGILKATLPIVTISFADGSTQQIPYNDVLPDSKLLDLSVFKSAFYGEKKANSADVVSWLRNDLQNKFPGTTPTSMTVDWTAFKIPIDDPDSRTGAIVRTVTVDLTKG